MNYLEVPLLIFLIFLLITNIETRETRVTKRKKALEIPSVIFNQSMFVTKDEAEAIPATIKSKNEKENIMVHTLKVTNNELENWKTLSLMR